MDENRMTEADSHDLREVVARSRPDTALRAQPTPISASLTRPQPGGAPLTPPKPDGMTGVELRAATNADIEVIAEIWHRGWRDGHLGHVPEALVAHRTPESFRVRTARRIDVATVAVVPSAAITPDPAVTSDRALTPHATVAPDPALAPRASSSAAVAGFVMVVGDEVEQVFVAADHRGSGVAALLLTEAERQVAAAGFAEAWLAVVPGNVRARRFYEREGWRDTGGFDYRAETAAGTVAVPCRRYAKSLS
jgi:GNAT superfamily N-acetyltransferase